MALPWVERIKRLPLGRSAGALQRHQSEWALSPPESEGSPLSRLARRLEAPTGTPRVSVPALLNASLLAASSFSRMPVLLKMRSLERA